MLSDSTLTLSFSTDSSSIILDLIWPCLPKTDLDINGYSHVQGSFTGDLNNDGYDDLVFIKSSDGIKIKPFLIGTKVEIWFNDGNGNFTSYYPFP